MACDVTSLAAVKEAKRGSLSKEGLFHIRSLTNIIRHQCECLGKGVGAPHPLDLISKETQQIVIFDEMKNFELFSNQLTSQERDRLSGSERQETSLPLSVMKEYPKTSKDVWNFEEFVEVLEERKREKRERERERKREGE